MLGVHLFNFFPKPTNIATNTCKFTLWFEDIIYSNLILIFEPIIPSTDFAVNLHVKKKIILKLLSKFKFSHPFSGIIKKNDQTPFLLEIDTAFSHGKRVGF